MNRKKVLFISHDASRTGAPILLLRLLKWLKDNSDISFQILLRNGGPLEFEFKALAPVLVFNRYFSTKGFWRKNIGRLGFKKSFQRFQTNNLIKKFVRDGIGIVYSNTITNGEVLEFLSSLKCHVICHVHELEFDIQCYTGLKKFRQSQSHTHHYIAVSKAVKKNLFQNHGVPEDKIDLIYGFIPQLFEDYTNRQVLREKIREDLGINKNEMIIGASGSMDWRKGPDLFIQLAHAIYRRNPEVPVHFIWMGGEKQGIEFERLWHDVKKIGLENKIHFIGSKTNPMDYFASFDVFTLLSREDPYPLVCLEAASVGKPIVCFDKAGGTKEFVEDDCGFVVPYLDIEAMAYKVMLLLKSDMLRQQYGQKAAEKVRERHDISISAPKILKIIERYF